MRSRTVGRGRAGHGGGPAAGRRSAQWRRRPVGSVGPAICLAVALLAGLVWSGVQHGGVAEAADAGPLRSAAAARGIAIGSAVNAGALSNEQGYRARLGAEFDSVTPEDAMKWSQVEAHRGQLTFQQADAVVDFAAQHQQAVRGHTLVWHRSLPSWLQNGSFTAAELRGILKQHIEVMMGRYAGRVGSWDVVNEVLNEDGTLRAGFWLDRLGPVYIADAFRWARAADPRAKLYLNEYSAEWSNAKRAGLYALVRDLRAQGVPIDGVGFQSHFVISSQLTGLAESLRLFADLGVDVALTELDVRIPLPADSAELAAQARVYGRAVAACLAVERCRSITVWGFTDAHSWISTEFPGQGAATLLDAQLADKPAYGAVRAALSGSPGSPGDSVGRWRLDDPPGTVAADSSGRGHDAQVGGGRLGAEGRVPGRSAWLGNGTDSEASTAGPVLRTDTSFSVSAWVRLADKAAGGVAVSQDGEARSAFYLMYQAATDRWEFTAPSTPAQATTWQTARSSSVPRLGVWTHLAGVYDGGSGQLRLYVNGVLEGTRTGVTTWNAEGRFRIGRSSSGGRFAGTISDVQAWDRALAAANVSAVAGAPVGHWPFDGDGIDRTGTGRDGVPTSGGVSWTADRAGAPGAALGLDGTGSVDLAGPALHTDRSYSVAAWVRLAEKGGYRAVLSQDGGTRSAFYLQYHPTYDRWVLIVPTADSTTGTWQTARSVTVPTVGAWTHLAGVYDAEARELRLYVNGVKEATLGNASSWPSNGVFHVGRAIDGSRFAGAVDDARVYARALPDAEVLQLSRS